jgi:hypothetical protein
MGMLPVFQRRYSRSDLQDFGDCIQSSQIGPHLVQPLTAIPMAITPRITIHRLSMADPLPKSASYGLTPGISTGRLSISAEYALQ